MSRPIIVASLIIAAAILVGFSLQGGESGTQFVSTNTVGVSEMAVDDAVVVDEVDEGPIVEPVQAGDDGCDTGEGRWALLDLSGGGRRVASGGVRTPADMVGGGMADPFLARTYVADLRASYVAHGTGEDLLVVRPRIEASLSSVQELACVEQREPLVNELVGILDGSSIDIVSMGELAQTMGAPVRNGEVIVRDAFVVGGQIQYGYEAVPASEYVIVTRMDNGAVTYHRTYCANQIVEIPKDPPKVKPTSTTVPPTDTVEPSPTPMNTPTDEPTVTDTPTPTNTPTATPTEDCPICTPPVTEVLTNTPVPSGTPTVTPPFQKTSTNTPTPTATPTPTKPGCVTCPTPSTPVLTNTPVPTLTPTVTPVLKNTPTTTPTPPSTPTPPPKPSPTPTTIPTATPECDDCKPPDEPRPTSTPVPIGTPTPTPLI